MTHHHLTSNQHKIKEITTYIDPFADFAFKRIFASASSKTILKAFLNEILTGYRHIETIEYHKNEYPGETKDEGGAILDVVCTDERGAKFLIEVQRCKQKYFKERALFYTSRLISEQAPRGNRKEWDYQLKDVYLIALLEDFNLTDDRGEKYLHNICLCNRETGEIFYDKLGYTYIEICKFVKTQDELKTKLDKWLYALKHLKELKTQPSVLTEPEFEQFFSLAKYINLTPEERNMYNNSLKAKWDNANAREFAKEEGFEEGKEEGKHTEALRTALELKKEGLPIEFIEKITKLPVKEIEKL